MVVDLPAEQAFWRFADLDKIKPREHNMRSAAIAETVLEQQAGGDLYNRGVDCTICRWGRLLSFDPPHTIAFSWEIGPDWQVVSDPTTAGEVEISFAGDADGRTRVTLVRRHIDRHGGDWESLQAGLHSPNAWPLYLSRFEALTRDEVAR
jgi:uncharacterized protein YndB with AHSA1/START domain